MWRGIGGWRRRKWKYWSLDEQMSKLMVHRILHSLLAGTGCGQKGERDLRVFSESGYGRSHHWIVNGWVLRCSSPMRSETYYYFSGQLRFWTVQSLNNLQVVHLYGSIDTYRRMCAPSHSSVHYQITEPLVSVRLTFSYHYVNVPLCSLCLKWL